MAQRLLYCSWPRHMVPEDRPMDLVEKAAQRLAQLKKAGIDVTVTEAARADQAPATGHAAEALSTPERLAQALERAKAGEIRTAVAVPPRPPAIQVAHVDPQAAHVDARALAAADVDRQAAPAN